MPDAAKIKILFVIPSLQTGGAEIQLLSLIRGLDKNIFDITLAVFYQGNSLDAAFLDVPQVRIEFLHKRNGLDFSFLRRLKNLIKNGHFDVVQPYNISARLFAIFYAKRFRVPLVAATERTAKALTTSMGSRIYLFLEKFALRAADIVITNSAVGRNYVQRRGVSSDRIQVIYNGIDAGRINVTRQKLSVFHEFNINPGAFVVGMAARLQQIKDPITFVKIAALLQHTHIPIHFLLIGDGPMLTEVQQAINTHDLQQIFTCTGQRHDIADLLAALDVFVLTSNSIEGCSNALIEAQMLGIPAVVTDVGGNSEVIQHNENGFLFTPGNADMAADFIKQLHQHKDLQQRLAAQAQKLAAQRFSQAAMVNAYAQIYKSHIH